jgi:outer membrane usher protein FimD/PapC
MNSDLGRNINCMMTYAALNTVVCFLLMTGTFSFDGTSQHARYHEESQHNQEPFRFSNTDHYKL